MLSLKQLKDHSKKALEKKEVESNPFPISQFYTDDMKHMKHKVNFLNT